MSSSKEIFDIVKKWSMKEQVFKLKKPGTDKFDWLIELSYPFMHPQPMTMSVVNPKDKDFIMIQLPIKMSPQHQGALEKKGPAAFGLFYHRLQTVFLQKDITFSLNPKIHQWVAMEQIFYDGLTKDAYFKAIRKVHNAIILINMVIDEVIRMPTIKGGYGGKKDSGGTSGNIYS
ncbi:MAG: DUF2299 family protein [Candidatus Hodarchaeota archaeon]